LPISTRLGPSSGKFPAAKAQSCSLVSVTSVNYWRKKSRIARWALYHLAYTISCRVIKPQQCCVKQHWAYKLHFNGIQ